MENKKIRIIGDYDIDGVTATSILYLGFKELNANCDYVIPHRINDGYGINDHIVRGAISDKVELLITCDNGIAAFDAIKLAKENNIKIIITDHHEIPIINGTPTLPEADYIINPKCSENYKFKEICGANVAFKLIITLFRALKVNISKNLYQSIVELTAIATIGDVMPLIGENRAIVKQGLEFMKNPCNVGVKALMDRIFTGENNKIPNSYDIGFKIGPCINATGRLETALTGVELFTSNDYNNALQLADKLFSLNEKRKEMTTQSLVYADEMMEKTHSFNNKVIVLLLENCHESIAGIVAGRIKEKYYRPTIVMTLAKEGLKGSGRSIEPYHMHKALSEVNYLIDKFGGHHMACGLSIKKENFNRLCDELNKNAENILSDDNLIEPILIDRILNFNEIDKHVIKDIKLLEPLGQGNRAPVLAAMGVEILSLRYIGKEGQFIKLELKNNNISFPALVFNNIEDFIEMLCKEYGDEAIFNLQNRRTSNYFIDIIFEPQINIFNGEENIQIIVKNFKIH